MLNVASKKSGAITGISAENLQFGELIVNPTEGELRKLAQKDETTTEFGSPAYVTKYRSRAAQFTRSLVDGTLTDTDMTSVTEAKEFLRSGRYIQLDRCLGSGEKKYHCRLFVSAQYARLALMFYKSLGPIKDYDDEPDFVTVDIPEFSEDRSILVDTLSGVTFVLGSDYYGEIKKSFLRQFMYATKQAGGLGLHAGSKEVWARSKKSGLVERKGYLFFGLSGTGKTSLTCHEYDLNESDGEYIRVRQDDVVALMPDAYCVGSEPEGFYIKTEGLHPEDQHALYEAAVSKEAVFENVYVQDDGKVDFDDTSLTGNGRAVVLRREVMHTDEEIDMPSVDALIFITRNPLVPPIARLNSKQAILAFMLGESVKTSAADPNAKGEPVREVGTNPFIVGDRGEEGNRLKKILDKNPQITSYILNTGYIGRAPNRRKIKILETVAILRELCRNGIEWRYDEALNLEVPLQVEGVDSQIFDMAAFFDENELQQEMRQLRKERTAWLMQFDSLDNQYMEDLY